MKYQRMPIEVESPEETGYSTIAHNLAESSVRDIYFRDLNLDLNELFLCYGAHRGDPALREAIIRQEPSLSSDDVLVCPGAATALFIVSTTLLSSSDHLIVLRPNYATNIETPKAIGCGITYIDLDFENGFQLDIESVKQAVQPNTKLISLTSPHNPTGIVFNEELIRELIAFAAGQNIFVLVDETYRYLDFKAKRVPYYAHIASNVISVCSLSKAFGVPGIRIGWLICKDATRMTEFLAAKEQIVITNSVLDEAIALHILQNTDHFLLPAHEKIHRNFSILQEWMQQQPFLEWIEPAAGVVCFPRIKKEHRVDTRKMYEVLLHEFRTVVGPGHWFEQDDRCMRIGFAYPDETEFRQGLQHLQQAIEAALIN